MKTAEEVLLSHFGCSNPVDLFNKYGIDLTMQAIIQRSMFRYAEQAIDRCAEKAENHLFGNNMIANSVKRVKKELK